jgi:hypothetical protein
MSPGATRLSCGSMPKAAWVEIRDPAGELLESIPAEIDGGGIYAQLPAFPPGTRGTVQLCTRSEGEVWRDEAELRKLPTNPALMITLIG